ncbi:hypothetical protein CHUAL_013908 [Chamberlinius hualienensis]
MPLLRSKRIIGESEAINFKSKKRKVVSNTDDKSKKAETVKGKANAATVKGKANAVTVKGKANVATVKGKANVVTVKGLAKDVKKKKSNKKTETPQFLMKLSNVRKIKNESKRPEVLAKASIATDGLESGGDSSSECDWEEVEELREPVIPKEGVTITIEAPNKKHNKKPWNIHGEIIRRMNRFKQETQLSIHKVHLLCLLAYGLKANYYVNMKLFHATALSLMSEKFLIKCKKDVSVINRLLSWFKANFEMKKTELVNVYGLERLMKSFESGIFFNEDDFVCAFLIYLRILNFNARLVISFRPSMLKVPCDELIRQQPSQSNKLKEPTKASESAKNIDKQTPASTPSVQKSQNKKSIPKETVTVRVKNKECENNERRSTRVKKLKKVNYSCENDSGNENTTEKQLMEQNSSSDFEPIDSDGEEEKTKKRAKPVKRKRYSRKSADKLDENNNEMWIEVLLSMDKEREPQWISVDVINQSLIADPYDLEKKCTKPFVYVVAFDENDWVIDVTRRYAEGCLRPDHRKCRVEYKWWEEALKPFQNPNVEIVNSELRQMDDRLLARPLPNTYTEFKGHPFYVLKKDLLKFEGLYPPDVVPVGYFRKEPIYGRDCVHLLHARETWFKEARVVKLNETSYKIVKPRPKWNKHRRELIYPEQPLELFGKWQTEDYVPPVATNGIVPRNEHGNVDFLKACMLPIGTVHLRLPGLIKVARKLNIDCAAAFVGWEFSGGSNHPVFDGWVVCKEFEDVVVDAWREEQDIIKEREQAKKDKRVYGNWKRLIRGVLIAEKLKARYLNK